MGLFNKIKNILFEEDEMEEIPVYTKEEKGKIKEQREVQKPIVEEKKISPLVKENIAKHDPIQIDENTHFTNVKRDIDFSYEEERDPIIPQETVPKKLEMPKPKAPEKKESPFMSFDEDEFERINAHLVRNEERGKEEKKDYSNRKESMNKEKYRVDSNAKRPFRPSPVISPVYGILDKNYTKDDIVDKQDGVKREVIRPVVRKEIQSELVKKEEPFKVNVDSVRKKAFGPLEELEKQAIDVHERFIEEEELVELPAYQEVSLQTEEELPTYTDNEIEEIPYEDEKDSILEHLKKDIMEEEEESVESILDKVPVLEEEEIIQESKEENVSSKGRILDDMEKTSTLQILDDIEKELNAIKPIAKEYKDGDTLTEKERLEKSDTLENDLFDLIDSMYEEGEEDEDDD